MIVSSSIIQYNTSDIKRALDTKITEFSNDGYYDYLPLPSYTFELPADEGPFWKRDNIVIKWDYSEPLNDLIPLSNIYLVSSSAKTLILEDVETRIKNVNWDVPTWTTLETPYHFEISTLFEGERIYDTSSVFTVDKRYINILTDAPKNPIVANEGNTFTIDWRGHGTGEYVKIELLDVIETNTITIEDNIGRLIGNEQTSGTGSSNGDPPNPAVIQVIEQNKYIGNNTTYTWTVDDIPFDAGNVILKITDSAKSFVYGYTPNIELKVPFIGINNFIGRRMGAATISEVSMSGDGEALLSVYGFNPPTREVISGESLTFNYDSTNAVQVYLTQESAPNTSIVFPTLNGIYTIDTIEQDDIYTVNAKDIHDKLRMATFNVDVVTETGTNETNIAEFTLVELLNHCITLGEEATTSGDAIIEPGAPILSKILQYGVEASQMDEGTNYATVKFLLSLVNEEILVVLWNGVEESPQVLLGASDLRNRVGEANIEVSKRLQGTPVAGVTISGYIKSESVRIPGVSMHFNNNGGETETDEFGYYTHEVPALYSGSATPSHPEYNFVPADKQYDKLEENRINQNYEGIYIPPVNRFEITSLPTMRVFQGEFNTKQLEAINGTLPYTWSLIAGTLPDGLNLSTDGIISGEPTTLGFEDVEIQAVDSDNHQDSFDLKIIVLRRA